MLIPQGSSIKLHQLCGLMRLILEAWAGPWGNDWLSPFPRLHVATSPWISSTCRLTTRACISLTTLSASLCVHGSVPLFSKDAQFVELGPLLMKYDLIISTVFREPISTQCHIPRHSTQGFNVPFVGPCSCSTWLCMAKNHFAASSSLPSAFLPASNCYICPSSQRQRCNV